MKLGTVLRVVLTDKEGDIRYRVLGPESVEGWIKKKSRPKIRLFAKVPDEKGRDVSTLEAYGGVLVHAQCPNCLTPNPEAFKLCTRCGRDMTIRENPADEPGQEEAAKDDPYGGVPDPAERHPSPSVDRASPSLIHFGPECLGA